VLAYVRYAYEITLLKGSTCCCRLYPSLSPSPIVVIVVVVVVVAAAVEGEAHLP
jgi:ABC-type glucose/galactose transport system permease subunit